MIRLYQRVNVFYISKFEAAVKAMKDSSHQKWAQDFSQQEKNRLFTLYTQATHQNHQKQNENKRKFANMGASMTSFKAGQGKQTAQGMTEGQVLKQQFNFGKQKSKKNENITKSSPEKVSQQGYGNRTGGSEQINQSGQRKENMPDQSVKSKEQAQNQYINLARSILEKNKAEKYIKDF